jgi:mannose/fructose/N-acetylgalactosamine-specific phosphotransferase system component IIC
LDLLISAKILLAAFVGAALELDSYFVGMTLISQPVIAGGIAGWICGDFFTGIFIGSLVQLVWISPPVGAYVPPSSSAIAFTATVLAISIGIPAAGKQSNALMMFCLIIGASTGYFVGQADIWNRKLNTLILHAFEPAILKGGIWPIIAAQAFAFSAKFLRDALLYLIIFVLGTGIAAKIFLSMPPDIVRGLEKALWVMPVIGLAVIYETFRTKMGTILHIALFLIFYLVFWKFNRVDPVFFMLAAAAACAIVIYNFVWNKRSA